MAAVMSRGVPLARLLPDATIAAGQRALEVSGLALDSRRVQPGDLFLAVAGGQQDGRAFIPQAVANGCVAVVAEAANFAVRFPRESAVMRAVASMPLILADNLQGQVSDIAARFYGRPGDAMAVYGVTGTNGKTTCASLIAQMAALLGHGAGLIGTLGWGMVGDKLAESGMTTPDAVSLQHIQFDLKAQGAEVLAMEVSSHSLDQGRVTAAGIDCAIFTNLSRDHLDYHGSEEAYGAAKARLFALPSVTRAVINTDDAFGARLAAHLPAGVELTTYGVYSQAQVRASSICLGEEGLNFHIHTPWGAGQVNSTLLGEFNVLNLLAVLAAFAQGGVALERLLALVPRLKAVPGRMEMLSLEDCPRVVVDYAHTPDALEKALLALRHHCRGRLWCVFGCGGDRDSGKRPQMGAIAERLADVVIVSADNPRSEQPEAIAADIVAGAARPEGLRVVLDRRQAIAAAIAEAAPGDCILIAGKGHENYQQIGSVKRPFSDVQVATEALQLRQERRPGEQA